MNTLIATPVVKNKFWVVEEQGTKVATIQARDDGGFVYVHDDQREYYTSTKQLKEKLNIKFAAASKKSIDDKDYVYGFPVKGKKYNVVFDVQRKLPIYTKQQKSKSFYCAGYYLIELNGSWSTAFCPKNITLNRYNYLGPFASNEEMLTKLKELK